MRDGEHFAAANHDGLAGGRLLREGNGAKKDGRGEDESAKAAMRGRVNWDTMEIAESEKPDHQCTSPSSPGAPPPVAEPTPGVPLNWTRPKPGSERSK